MSRLVAPERADHPVAVTPVSFGRVLRSEGIKFRSLRSSYWAVLATLLAMVLIAVLMAAASTLGEAPGPDGRTVLALGYTFAQVVVAVLGALLITGEYSTGQIRSSLSAVPTRTPVLAAKALVIAVVGFVLGVVGVALSYLATAPVLGSTAADLGDPEVLRVFWGTGLYLAAVGLFGLGIGALLRHTAAAVAAVLGVLLLLSTLVQLLMMASDAFVTIYAYLPSTAGERIVAPAAGAAAAQPGAPDVLAPWTGFAVLVAYVLLTLVAAGVTLRRRDA